MRRGEFIVESRPQRRLVLALLASCIAGACAYGDLWDGPRTLTRDPCATPEICGTTGDDGLLTAECIADTPDYVRCICKGGFSTASGNAEATDPCVIDPCQNSEALCGGPNRCFHDPPTILPAEGARPVQQIIVGDWRCDCPDGTRHTTASPQSTCIPIDECDFNTPDGGRDLCGTGRRCTNTPNGRRCECDCGFVETDGGSCVDPCEDFEVCGVYRDMAGTKARAGVCYHVERDAAGECRDKDIHPTGVYCDCETEKHSGFVLDGGVCVDVCTGTDLCGQHGHCERSGFRYQPNSDEAYAPRYTCTCEEGSRYSDRMPAMNCATDGGVVPCGCEDDYVPWAPYPLDQACIRVASPCEDVP